MSTTATAPDTDRLYLHFTTITDAVLMVAAGVIGQTRTNVDRVWAAAVGGVYSPCVQLRGRRAMEGRDDETKVAILFTTAIAPDLAYTDEVKWIRPDDLPVTDATIITLDEAIALLDGTATDLED